MIRRTSYLLEDAVLQDESYPICVGFLTKYGSTLPLHSVFHKKRKSSWSENQRRKPCSYVPRGFSWNRLVYKDPRFRTFRSRIHQNYSCINFRRSQ